MSYKDFRNNLVVLLPLLLSVILPCIHLYSISANPTFNIPIIDSKEYIEAARQISGGAFLETRTEHLSLLYTWFIASIFSFFGPSLLAVKLFQTLMNLGSALLLYKVIHGLSSKREAVIALYIWAFYGPIIFFTCEILSVSLILFVYNLSLYTVFVARKERSFIWWGTSGFVLGVSVLARPDILIFLLLMCGALLFSCGNESRQPREGVSSFLYFFSGAILPLLAASFINYSTSGEFRFLPTDSGLNLFMGNNPDFSKSIGARPGLYWDSLTELPGKEGTRSPGSFYLSMVGRYMLDDFTGFIANISYKVMTLFNGYELPSTLDIYTFRKYSLVLALLTWTTVWFSFPFGLLLPLGCVGIFIEWKEREHRWLLLMCLSFLLSLIGFWNSSRYRVVLVPFFLFFASRAAVFLYDIFLEKQKKRVPRFLVAFLFLLLLSNIPYKHFSKNYNFEAEMYAFTGIHLAGREKIYEDAVERLTKSLALQKQNDSGCSGYDFFFRNRADCRKVLHSYHNSLRGHSLLTLADAYMGEGDYEKSSLYYKRATLAGPVSFLAYNNLGTLRMKQKEFGQALLSLKKSIALRPDYPLAHTNIGIVFVRLGRPGEAVPHFSEAIMLAPNDSEAYYNLAVALAKVGNREEAVVNLMKSLDIEPERAVRFFQSLK